MFYLKRRSKVALHHLCTQMDFELIDVQIPTTLMENFGAYPIIAEFLIFCRCICINNFKILYERSRFISTTLIFLYSQHPSGARHLGTWYNTEKSGKIKIFKEGNAHFGERGLEEPNDENGKPKVNENAPDASDQTNQSLIARLTGLYS